MNRKQLEKIYWKFIFKKYATLNYTKLKSKEIFIKNLIEYADDKEFLSDINVKSSLSGKDVKDMADYLESVESRRGFVKSFAKGATATAVIAVAGTKQLGVFDTIKDYSTNKFTIKGVCYDIGTKYTPSFITNSEIDRRLMELNINIIKNQLKCNAVRIYGEDINKLIECSRIALGYELQVWLSPRMVNASESETLQYIRICAAEAENLRRTNPNVIFIVGNELTLDMVGLVPGVGYIERGTNLIGNVFVDKLKGLIGSSTFNKKLNQFLEIAVKEVRTYFKGYITYASGNWEEVEWNIFDIIGINHYLNKFNRLTYTNTLQKLKKFKKPIAVLEFGCCTYKGANDKGGSGYNIVNWNLPRAEIVGNKIRDENVQLEYVLNLLKVFVQDGIYASFVHTFVETQYISYEDNPKYDLDTASFNLIRVYPKGHDKSYFDGNIIPKKAFYAIADFYKNH